MAAIESPSVLDVVETEDATMRGDWCQFPHEAKQAIEPPPCTVTVAGMVWSKCGAAPINVCQGFIDWHTRVGPTVMCMMCRDRSFGLLQRTISDCWQVVTL